MNFKETTREAARAAQEAVEAVMRKYRQGFLTDEDDISPALISRLDEKFDGYIGGIKWQSSILRHRRGKAAEEKQTGADLALFFELDTPTHQLKKGVIVQAKRSEPGTSLPAKDLYSLQNQCRKMLAITPAAFVFDYARHGMRCASASKCAGVGVGDLYGQCDWTTYRFFLEFFRCPIGDPNFKSALAKDLSIPDVIKIQGRGEFDG